MIIVDTALQKREAEGQPIRVAMVGAGFMGRGVALQLLRVVPGMRLVAIANRHLAGAQRAYREAGADHVCVVETRQQLEEVIGQGQYAVPEGRLCDKLWSEQNAHFGLASARMHGSVPR